jgi:hypothetical protein
LSIAKFNNFNRGCFIDHRPGQKGVIEVMGGVDGVGVAGGGGGLF